MTDRIGFVGLGNIGKPMAINLADDGFDLSVYDIYQPSCEELATKGAKVSASLAEMAGTCDVICICVRDDKDVDEVLRSQQGVFFASAPGTVVIVHSTVRKSTLLRLADEAREHEVYLLDTAISGGATGAEQRNLCYMVGGPAELLERCRPIFETSAAKIIHAGDVGAGLTLKLCNNLMTYASFVAIHESARLAQASGLSLDLLKEVGEVNGVVTPLMAGFVEGRNMVRASCDEESFRNLFAGFAAIGVKDMDAGLDLATELEIELPGARCTRGLVESVFFDEY
ncbi:MAG: NAD(P)-dependent oxidoreductase [Chloroflexi bacterium]|nr:NAD(P)-dependent oxidoreductase [Chloroflexota bacterium]